MSCESASAFVCGLVSARDMSQYDAQNRKKKGCVQLKLPAVVSPFLNCLSCEWQPAVMVFCLDEFDGVCRCETLYPRSCFCIQPKITHVVWICLIYTWENRLPEKKTSMAAQNVLRLLEKALFIVRFSSAGLSAPARASLLMGVSHGLSNVKSPCGI